MLTLSNIAPPRQERPLFRPHSLRRQAGVAREVRVPSTKIDDQIIQYNMI